MQLDAKLVIVPSWLMSVVKEFGIPKKDLLNLVALKGQLSKDDLATYIGVNLFFEHFASNDKYASLKNTQGLYYQSFELLDIMGVTKSLLDSQEIEDQTRLLSDIASTATTYLDLFNADQTVYDDIMTVFTNLMISPSYRPRNTSVDNFVLELFTIEDGVFGLTLSPLIDLSASPQLDAIEKSVRLLTKHYSYEDVCRTPIFHYWCALMHKNNAV